MGTLLGLHPHDLILHSDADEVSFGATLGEGANIAWSALQANPDILPIVDFDMAMYYFSLTHKVQYPWAHAVVLFPFGATPLSDITAIRRPGAGSQFASPNMRLVASLPNAGLHMSYCFTIDGIITKVRRSMPWRRRRRQRAMGALCICSIVLICHWCPTCCIPDADTVIHTR